MKVHYDKDEDILMIELNGKQIDYAEQTRDLIVHFSPKREAVLLEILDASHFFAEQGKVLPKEIPPYLTTRLFNTIRKRLRGAIGRRAGKQKFFATAS